MNILLLGKNGQLGWELQRTLLPMGNVIAMGREDLDLSDFKKIIHTVRAVCPQLIVNASAYTAVDKAEGEQELALAINGTAVGVLAEAAKNVGAALIHYSTDYIFDGIKNTPYTEDDTPNPINIYGETKLAGERAIQQVEVPFLILRTSWVYGLRGKNFFATMMKLFREQEEIKVVDDQIGAPTWSRCIAEATANIVAQGAKDIKTFLTDKSGVYHLSCCGEVSWFDFANAIKELDSNKGEHLCKRIHRIPTLDYPTPARRPKYSALNNDKASDVFSVHSPQWKKTLEMALGVS